MFSLFWLLVRAANFSLGFAVQYNWLRPHESLGDHTPAWVAGIQLPFEEGWGNLMNWAIVWRTPQQKDS